MISIEWKYYCAQKNNASSINLTFTSEICMSTSSDRRPSTAGTVRSDTMDLRRLKQITELESRRLQLLEEAEDRRDVVLKQKEIEKNQLIQKDMYFAEKNEQVSKMRERLQRDIIQARQIIHRQVKEENDKGCTKS